MELALVMTISRILPLSPQVANQIAAGEVIERPASIIKELVENALDAGASEIDVDVEGAGVHLIRVRDNGTGIEKDDLPLAFLRHATSKIRTSDDLDAIQSLGFRGEALASIAAVSRCRVISATKAADTGWAFSPDALDKNILPAAHAMGTTVEVADLFYNVPVRRKFLRSPKTEFQAIDDMMKRLALSHPAVKFTFKNQQKPFRLFPKAINAAQEQHRIGKICGQQFANEAVEITLGAGDLAIKGWVGLPEFSHRQADCQYFFINQRLVKDRFITQIIRSVFQQHPQTLEGTYPCYVLYLDIPPTEVDVNVHPTKQEVRFHQPRWVHDFIRKAIEDAVAASGPVDAIEYEDSSNLPVEPIRSIPSKTAVDPMATNFDHPGYNIKSPNMTARPYVDSNAMIKPKTEQSSNLKIPTSKCYQADDKQYAFLEQDQQLIIFDLKQVRIPLLKLLLKDLKGRVPSKALMLPIRIPKLSKTDVEQAITLLQHWGFRLIEQGNEAVLCEQPAFLSAISEKEMDSIVSLTKSADFDSAIIDYLSEHGLLSLIDTITYQEVQNSLEKLILIVPASAIVKVSKDKFQQWMQQGTSAHEYA